MIVQYEELTREQKEILRMITEDCKKIIENCILKPEIKTIDSYIIEVKFEEVLL